MLDQRLTNTLTRLPFASQAEKWQQTQWHHWHNSQDCSQQTGGSCHPWNTDHRLHTGTSTSQCWHNCESRRYWSTVALTEGAFLLRRQQTRGCGWLKKQNWNLQRGLLSFPQPRSKNSLIKKATWSWLNLLKCAASPSQRTSKRPEDHLGLQASRSLVSFLENLKNQSASSQKTPDPVQISNFIKLFKMVWLKFKLLERNARLDLIIQWWGDC